MKKHLINLDTKLQPNRKDQKKIDNFLQTELKINNELPLFLNISMSPQRQKSTAQVFGKASYAYAQSVAISGGPCCEEMSLSAKGMAEDELFTGGRSGEGLKQETWYTVWRSSSVCAGNLAKCEDVNDLLSSFH